MKAFKPKITFKLYIKILANLTLMHCFYKITDIRTCNFSLVLKKHCRRTRTLIDNARVFKIAMFQKNNLQKPLKQDTCPDQSSVSSLFFTMGRMKLGTFIR